MSVQKMESTLNKCKLVKRKYNDTSHIMVLFLENNTYSVFVYFNVLVVNKYVLSFHVMDE